MNEPPHPSEVLYFLLVMHEEIVNLFWRSTPVQAEFRRVEHRRTCDRKNPLEERNVLI